MMRVIAVLALSLCSWAQAAQRAEMWISNAQPIDGTGNAKVPAANLHIVDGHIAEIGPAAARSGALDLHGAYLLPGFIDAHTHIEDPAAARRAHTRY